MWNSFRVTENKCGVGRVIIQNTRGKENLRETLLRYAGMWQMIPEWKREMVGNFLQIVQKVTLSCSFSLLQNTWINDSASLVYEPLCKAHHGTLHLRVQVCC